MELAAAWLGSGLSGIAHASTFLSPGQAACARIQVDKKPNCFKKLGESLQMPGEGHGLWQSRQVLTRVCLSRTC